MTEDFVNFELAKKLKEKGFDEECLSYYTSDYTLYLNKVVLCDDKYFEVAEIDYEECLRSYNTQKDRLLRTIVDAPTISQVLKWLREEKKLHIELWTVGKKPIKWCHTITTLNHVGEKQGWSSGERGDSYEAAAIAGIEYVIDNLI